MNKIFFTILSLIFVSTASDSNAQEILANKRFQVSFYCLLSIQEKMDCSTFERSFFDNNSGLISQVLDAREADLQVRITNQSRPGNLTRYYIRIKPSDRFEANTLDLPPMDFNNTTDGTLIMSAIEARIRVGFAAFQEIEKSSVGVAGDITISTKSAVSTDPNKPTPGGNPGNWYIEAGTSGTGTTQGQVQSSSLAGSVVVDYFDPKGKFRFQVSPSYSQRVQTIPNATGVDRGSVTNPRIYLKGIYSVSKRWSFALIGLAAGSRGSNLDSYRTVSTGVEYALVPYRTNETQQLMFRIGPEFTVANLEKANERGNLQEQVFAGFAQIAYVNQFIQDRVVFNASAKALTYPGLGAGAYNIYSGSLSINVRATKALVFSGGATFSQQKKSLTYPAAVDYSNPAQVLFITGAAGVNYSYNFGVKLIFGAASKKASDQRWN